MTSKEYMEKLDNWLKRQNDVKSLKSKLKDCIELLIEIEEVSLDDNGIPFWSSNGEELGVEL